MSPESWAKTAIDVETMTARGRRIFFMRAENTCQKFQALPMRFLHQVAQGKNALAMVTLLPRGGSESLTRSLEATKKKSKIMDGKIIGRRARPGQ
jgi:hypothetical protein